MRYQSDTMIADRLKELRSIGGVTRHEASRLAGLSERHCDVIERRRNDHLNLVTVTALAKVFGCTVGYLAAGEGEPPEPANVKRAVARARRRLEG